MMGMLVGVGGVWHGHYVEGGILNVKVVGNEWEIVGEGGSGIWWGGVQGSRLWSGACLVVGRLLGIQGRGCEVLGCCGWVGGWSRKLGVFGGRCGGAGSGG